MKTVWGKRLARLYLPVYRFESESMKIAYAGYSSVKKNYFTRFILETINSQDYSGRKGFWRLPEIIRNENYDFVVAEISPITFSYFQNFNGYMLPEWIKMYIKIDRPVCEIISRRISDFPDVIRKIRKYDLTPEILKDQASFTDFNYRFYQPYMSKRHGEEAWIEDLNSIWKSTAEPFIVAIKEKNNIVGMSLVFKSGDTFSLSRLGLLEGKDVYRRHGVIGALYYFAMLEAKKMGCRYFDLGGTRPFLSDGLTKFKKGLGAEFNTYDGVRNEVYLWLGINEKSEKAKEFLRKNPFIHITNDYKVVTNYQT